ncbi:MAG: class I SAM-dependent methyltransferase [Rhodoferax sp.]|nr:class I SAM-dependent methyltransferase [Rhodoferax sp.]MCF8211280.1 class I SAM-dependent methyltransferase [Rhodoferax sp.]
MGAPESSLVPPPSQWITRWTHLLAPACTVLDVACGSGRHSLWFARQGYQVTGLDRDVLAAQALGVQAQFICADLEAQPWPLTHLGRPSGFGAVVVTNYLWRPLLATVVQSVALGGVLLYETFAQGNETVGRPTRPDFLLRPGELLQVCDELQVVAYEHGFLDEPARFVQRIAAVRPQATHAQPQVPARHRLSCS